MNKRSNIELGSDRRIRDQLNIKGAMVVNPNTVDLDTVIPVFDLSAGGQAFGTDRSPTHMQHPTGNWLTTHAFTYDLEDLTDRYCARLLVDPIMRGTLGYDIGETDPDYLYVGWVPRDKLFVPFVIDWTLQFQGGAQAELDDRVAAVSLIMYSPDRYGSEGLRCVLQRQQFVIRNRNANYRNGTYACNGYFTHETHNLLPLVPYVEYNENAPVPPGIVNGAITAYGYSVSGSQGWGTPMVSLRPFALRYLPPNCGLGFHIGLDDVYDDETVFPISTFFTCVIAGHYYDANAAVIPAML